MGKSQEDTLVSVPANEVWHVYRGLELGKLVDELLPDVIGRVEVIQGDGGVGTIVKITFPPGPIPDQKAQFGTFDERCYEGNPLLCGPPLNNSCNQADSPSSTPNVSDGEEKEGGFMDMEVFYISFGVAYVIMLLAIVAVLYINPYWRRVWFYVIEESATTCYYAIVDNLCTLSNSLRRFGCLFSSPQS